MNLKTLGLDLLCSRQALLIVTIFFISYSSVAQTFKEDWESGRLRRPPWFEEGYSNTVSNRHSNSGRYSFKSELPARWHDNPRSEIAFGGANGVPQYQDQFTQWGMSFSVYVPSDFKEDPVKHSILQLKDIMDACDVAGGNPPFKIGVSGSRFDATVRWTDQKCATSLGLKYFNRVLNIQPGKWHYFVLNVGWDYRKNGNGYVHLYAKVGSPPGGNDRVINYNGPTGYNDNKGHYLKLGIYKWLWKDYSQVNKSKKAGVVSSVLYYDDIEIRKGRIPMATNQSPTANAGKDQTIELPNSDLTLYGSASDPDNNLGTYDWVQVSGPSNATINQEHTLTPVLKDLKEGIYIIRLIVKDKEGATDSDDVKITVKPKVNEAPTASAGPSMETTLPDDKVAIDGKGWDKDGSIVKYQWKQLSGPSDASLSGEHTDDVVVADLVEGKYVFELTVTDNDGATHKDAMQLTVHKAVNKGPSADAGSNLDITLPKNQITINGKSWDEDGKITKQRWKQKSGPSTATLSGETTNDLTASDLREGTYVFEFTVTDDAGATDTDAMQLVVNPAVNKAPTADAGSNLDITLPKNQVTINGKSWDEDGKITKQRWKQKSGPSTATLSGETTNDLTASDLQEGAYVFELTVTDDAGATHSDAMQVIVNPRPNQAPTADAGANKSLTLPKNSLTITGISSDPEGKISKQLWTQVSGPSTAQLSGDNTKELKVSNLVEGKYTFKFTVTDDQGLTAEDAMQVTVHAEAINQAPSADAGPNKVVNLPTSQVVLKGTGTDSDGTISSYQWKQVSGPSAATLEGASTPDLTAKDLKAGTYVMSLTVTDNGGATSDDQVTITVKAAQVAANQPPVANAGKDITITLPTNTVSLAGSGTDSDGSIATHQWSQSSGPANATLKGANSKNLTAEDLVAGVYEFQLQVTDNKGATHSDKVKVTVKAAEVTAQEEEVQVDVDPTPAPEPLTASANITDATCTAKNGALNLQVKGGVEPYSFEWSNGSKTKNLNNLTPGEYKVNITDSQGEKLSKTFTVDQITADLQVDAQITNATCSDKNGAIKVQASGGTGPYNFEWSSQARTSSLTQLSSGYYDLVVSDQNGCSKKVSFNVGMESGETTFDLSSETSNASCLGNDGSIALEVNGNDGPYSFVWEHGATGAVLGDLEDGKYLVTITDTHGCFMKKEYTINQTPGPAKPSILQAGDSLYIVQQAASYQWFKDSVAIRGGNRQAVHITEAGTYSVEISNDNTCVVSSDYFQSREPILPLSTTGTFNQVEFYPIPVQNEINYRITLNQPATTTVTIYDFTGKVLLTRDLGVVRSFATDALPFAEYPTGAYLIRAKANDEIVTKRFIKY